MENGPTFIVLLVGVSSVAFALAKATGVAPVSANRNLVFVLGWTIMAVLGLYLTGWVAMRYAVASGAASDRLTPPESQTVRRSSESRVRR